MGTSTLLLTLLGFKASLALALPHAVIRRQVNELRDNYDFIVAGGGTAGLTVANRLSEAFPDRTVLVVEYGIIEEGVAQFEPPGAPPRADVWNFNSLPIPALDNRRGSVTVGRVVGGSSVVNGQFFDRGSRRDYDEWMEVGGEAWADEEERWDWEGIAPAFRKSVTFTAPSEEDAEAYGYTWDEAAYGGDGQIHSYYPPFQWPAQRICWDAWIEAGVQPRIECANGDKDGICWVPTSQDPVTARRSHAGIGHYQDVIDERSNYDLLVRHKVLRVVYGDDHSEGPPQVEIRNLDSGEVQLVTASAEVVISAGALHTPQILQRSGIAARAFLEGAGIEVVEDLPGVGYNFHDHGGPSISATLTVPITPNAQTLNSNRTFGQEALDLYALRPAQGPYTLAMGNSAIYVSLPNITSSYTDMIDAVRQQIADGVEAYLPDSTPPEVIAGYEAQLEVMATSMGDPTQPILESPFSVGPSGSGFLLKPLSRGTVFLDPNNHDAAPVINYGTAANPIDLDIMASFVPFFRNYFNTPILQSYGVREISPGEAVQTDEQIKAYLRRSVNPSFMHPCCTAAMLPRDLGGVVGTDLRVYGVSGLRVADASIMSILPGTHTSATAYAIGEKAADIIIKAWSD